MPREIGNLGKIRDDLPVEAREIFDRMFELSITAGESKVRTALIPWVMERFGSLETIETQRVARVDNLVTGEGALFNELRTKRPIQVKPVDVEARIEAEKKDCDFCLPFEKTRTPIDILSGEIKRQLPNGDEVFLIATLAKYDARHSQIICPPRHHPYRKITEALVENWFSIAEEWYQKVHQKDPQALFPVFGLNILWNAGASIIHPHPHVILARKRHYPPIALFNRLRLQYEAEHHSDYFDDLFKVHLALGLATEKLDTRVIANLVPRKEKEIVVIAPHATRGCVSKNFISILWRLINCFVRDLGVQSFNLAVLFPPLEESEDWKGFPVVAHLLDRGSLATDTADIGLMELYFSSVVASDPFKVFPDIKESLGI